MNKMNDHRRYHPYHRSRTSKDRRYEDDENNDYRRPYKKTNSSYHHYHYHSSHSSSRHDDRANNRNYTDFSHRNSQKTDQRYQQSKTKTYASFSSTPPPLLSLPLVPPSPPPPPPPPPSPQVIVPHERESWVRSVKKTKTNESSEQKTQYLETMLRMPQQSKSSLNASRFDRMRFADNQGQSTTSSVTTPDLVDSSFHLVSDVENHDDIRTLEEILFNSTPKEEQPVPAPVVEIEPIPCSGFLIENCDEEQPLPSSSPPPPAVSDVPTVEETTIPINEEDLRERRVLLLNELDAAEAERKQESKRQKRLQQKLKQRQMPKDPIESSESASDWMIEYDLQKMNDPLQELTEEVRRSSVSISNEERTAKVNLILMKIQKQQEELRKLRKYVLSILGDQPERTSKKTLPNESNITQDLLLALLNQPTPNSCWLCSGKMYSEASTQCDPIEHET